MPTFELEEGVFNHGYSRAAGIDEAGRGPLAGPVVAAAVILPSGQPYPLWLRLVDDSKKLTPQQRRDTLEHIESGASAIGVGSASPVEIDSKGIVEATKAAMLRAIDDLPVRPEYLLIDFVELPEYGLPYRSEIRGDSLCYSIAAASIVAKVTRDRLMQEADAAYPGYGFSRHKGYGTPEHLRLLALRGPSPIHRRSFSPLRPREGVGRADSRPQPSV